MSDHLVLQERMGGVATITLNAPDKLNAFTADLHQALRDALDSLEQDPSCRCLIITGAGRAFCAGQDLNERVQPPGASAIDIGQMLDRDLIPLVSRLRSAPFPIIAAVNGTAAGAGASLALAADIVIASETAKFVLSFTRIGLGPDGGLSWILPRLIGDARARALSLLGGTVDAATAQDWGLIWRCIDGAALLPFAHQLAEELSQRPKAALRATKSSLNDSWRHSFSGQLGLERTNQRELGFSADYREGVDAFLNKRPPKYEP